MNPVILYREVPEILLNQELHAIKIFPHFNSRCKIKKDDLVICRYSCLPFYEELENDLNLIGAKLINSYEQHKYVADLKNYYMDLEKFTPKTWFRPFDVPKNEGPFVLKGATNSKKFLWNSHMFAENWNDMMGVYCKLQDDGLIGTQDIYIRKYISLKKYENSINGLPISKEFRFFIAYGRVLCGGFYWSNFVEHIKEKYGLPEIEEVPKEFLNKVINIIGNKINFYVIDVAQTIADEWIVIELNDGQMSGLSENNPYELYKNLKQIF